MKLTARLFSLTACLLALAAPTSVLAAKGERKKGKQLMPEQRAERQARPGVLLKKYDSDKNGAIDGTEIEALRKAYEADKTGPLKKLDANNDGTLDDKEIAEIKAPKGKGKDKGKAGKAGLRKKKQNA